MTIAICLNCGERRVGAITECGNCGVATSGLFGLDIMFSDRTMSVRTLEAFAGVIRSIRVEAADDELSRAAFLVHLSDHYPELLTFDPPEQVRERGRAVLSRIELPEIELQLRRSHPGGLPGPPTLKGSSVMVALGALIALFGLRLETYELAWYQDVRAILLVGLGSIFAVAGVQRAVLALRSRMDARESH